MPANDTDTNMTFDKVLYSSELLNGSSTKTEVFCLSVKEGRKEIGGREGGSDCKISLFHPDNFVCVNYSSFLYS